MIARSALLVGSLPFEDERTCMTRALDALGERLFCLPDGEIGDKSPKFPRGNRIAWVLYAIERLAADRDSWRMLKEGAREADGMAVGYDSIAELKPLRPPKELPAHLSFGYDRFALSSYALFRELRAARGLTTLRFQVGIPTGFALGFAFQSPIDWLRYTSAFNTVLAREVNAVLAALGDDVVIQIEVPPELYAAHLLPSPLMRLSQLSIRDLVGKIEPGAQLGVHLCLGDFRNQALLKLESLTKMVAFSNRLCASWPKTHTLRYVHYPFCEGAIPPRLDPRVYRSLRGIQLPDGTRFVAGFAHEKRSFDENVAVMRAIEDGLGHAVDVSTSCGLGRRTPEVAAGLLATLAKLTET